MTLDAPDDLTLQRAKKGDRKARAELVALYQRPVYALVSRMLVSNKSAVDDVAQESMIKMLVALPAFDPRGSAKLSTWVLTIAARTCIDALRRVKKTAELDDDALPGGGDPEANAIDRQMRARVEKVMAQLPDDQRAVLVLRAYHDLDYAEIAEALGVEEGTVKSRLARARAALKSLLGGES